MERVIKLLFLVRLLQFSRWRFKLWFSGLWWRVVLR